MKRSDTGALLDEHTRLLKEYRQRIAVLELRMDAVHHTVMDLEDETDQCSSTSPFGDGDRCVYRRGHDHAHRGDYYRVHLMDQARWNNERQLVDWQGRRIDRHGNVQVHDAGPAL